MSDGQQENTQLQAVIFDMDGVLTQTVERHKGAWKEMFDDYLAHYSGSEQADTKPFTDEDYKEYVDGKPRYEGVADFLASRQITPPRGEPTDSPTEKTVCGLGNRKNELFLKQLEDKGVTVFDDAIASVKRWRREGVPVAVISASRNSKRILDTAGITDLFDVIVDGQTAREQSLKGKTDIISEAARRLDVKIENAVVVEDSVSGVKAARALGTGLIVGVERSGDSQRLKKAGADQVTANLTELRL